MFFKRSTKDHLNKKIQIKTPSVLQRWGFYLHGLFIDFN
ncbi:hypothetical protein O59_004164 [Cellvibrio sp. BR]|nr:hypothetical protein O59_004164 [Cellvibrio sp. BR]